MSMRTRARIPIGLGLFLVLIRVAIGWHFFYEGYTKLTSDGPGKVPFTAEHYLRASQGPLRDYFLQLIDDPDGLDQLNAARVQDKIDELHRKSVAFYDLDDEQKNLLEVQRKRYGKKASGIFEDPEFQLRIKDYKNFLRKTKHSVATGGAFEGERIKADRDKLDGIRKELLAASQVPIKDYLRKVNGVITTKQRAAGSLPPDPTPTRWVDLGMSWGLTLVGAGLMLGIFTRLCCLGAAVMLASFYLSMPPWPGIPAPPNAEGHYMFVNKNMIEFLAVLALMMTRSGRWFGFDGWIRGIIDLFEGRPAPPAPADPRVRSGRAQAAT